MVQYNNLYNFYEQVINCNCCDRSSISSGQPRFKVERSYIPDGINEMDSKLGMPMEELKNTDISNRPHNSH